MPNDNDDKVSVLSSSTNIVCIQDNTFYVNSEHVIAEIQGNPSFDEIYSCCKEQIEILNFPNSTVATTFVTGNEFQYPHKWREIQASAIILPEIDEYTGYLIHSPEWSYYQTPNGPIDCIRNILNRVADSHRQAAILFDINLENIESINRTVTYLLERFPPSILSHIYLSPLYSEDKPTIPYMIYAHMFNSLNRQFYKRIFCNEIVLKSNHIFNLYKDKSSPCFNCVAYFFCKDCYTPTYFFDLDVSSPLRRQICNYKRSIIHAHLILTLEFCGHNTIKRCIKRIARLENTILEFNIIKSEDYEP